MRIVVTGATGNVGSQVVRALAADPAVGEVVGLARRRPELRVDGVSWLEADVTRADLTRVFRGADAVVHLAWLIQPARDREQTRRVNVLGSHRVFTAVAEAGVPVLVHASSVGTYAPHPGDDPVDESWANTGIPTSFYSRDKAAAERGLDVFEAEHPEIRCARLRPGVVFQRDAAQGIRRLFAGPLLPRALLAPGRLGPVLPMPRGLRIQAVHAADLAQAYRAAVLDEDARGAFNVAASPVLDGRRIAAALGARAVTVPAAPVRLAAGLTWHGRLQPTPPGWLDLGTRAPLMDTTRARVELGWAPTHDADDALAELLAGMHDGADAPTPPLAAGTSGPFRVRELLTSLGSR